MISGFREFYRSESALFDRLVAREDWRGRLIGALNEIRPLDGLRVVEYGAGTGRLTRQLAEQADFVRAFDIEPRMLSVARHKLQATDRANWSLAVADSLQMPLRESCADLVIEGWSFAHAIAWRKKRWREACDSLVADIARVLVSGGTAMLIETLGTGRLRPNPPGQWLPQLYRHWQEEHGFERRWLRTDYRFESQLEMDELLRSFFGAEVADEARAAGSLIVPECTGVWHKRFV